MYCKPLLSLGCLSFCGILIYSHGTLNGEGEVRICVGRFSASPCKNASFLYPQKDHFSSQVHALYHLTPSLPSCHFLLPSSRHIMFPVQNL